jgi:hypothetical protein
MDRSGELPRDTKIPLEPSLGHLPELLLIEHSRGLKVRLMGLL